MNSILIKLLNQLCEDMRNVPQWNIKRIVGIIFSFWGTIVFSLVVFWGASPDSLVLSGINIIAGFILWFLWR